MPITFPSSPTTSQTYTVGARTWTWNGSVWELNANTVGVASVTATEIATGAVIEAKVGAGAITETKLGTGAVTSTKLATNAVTTASITANAVTSAKLETSPTISGTPTFGNGSLPSTLSSEVVTSKDYATTTNGDQLIRKIVRTSAGSDWQSASWYLQRRVDATDQAFIRMTNNQISLGYAATEQLIADSSGRVRTPNMPFVKASSNAAGTTWNSGSTYVFPFNVALNNANSYFNTSTYAFTCPVAGRYLVQAQIQWNITITNQWVFNMYIARNGAGEVGTYQSGRNLAYDKQMVVGTILAAANDTIDVRVLMNATVGSPETSPGDMRNTLYITLLG